MDLLKLILLEEWKVLRILEYLARAMQYALLKEVQLRFDFTTLASQDTIHITMRMSASPPTGGILYFIY